MKTLVIGFALLAVAIAPAPASGPQAHASGFTCNGFPGRDVHFSERRDPTRARIAITSQDGEVTMLLTNREVVLQLSDRTMRHVRRELKDAEEEHEDNWLGSVFVTAVAGTVRELLDHSVSWRVKDLRDVTYEDGCMQFIGRNGKAVLGDEGDCDSDVTHTFSEPDARNFIREFRRVKAGR